MPQSHSFALIHLIFSTRDRFPFFAEPIRKPLHANLATVARNMDCECYRVGGVADHVHLAVRLARTVTIAKLVEELKTSSCQYGRSIRLPRQRRSAIFSNIFTRRV